MFFLRRLRREMSHGAIKTGLTHIIKHTLSPLLYITFHNIIPTVVTQHELYSGKWSKCILLPYDSENWKMISNRADYDTLHKHFPFSCYCFKYSLFIGNVKNCVFYEQSSISGSFVWWVTWKIWCSFSCLLIWV